MSFLLALLTGFTAALAHVLSGPDHLAAVIPFAIEEKKKSWKIGFAWGLGHLTGMLMIGLLFYFLKENIQLDSISAYSEIIVGFILIAIGIWAITKASGRGFVKKYWHFHISSNNFLHKHKGDIHNDTDHHTTIQAQKKLNNNTSAYYIGVIHGFAGIAHFILFLPVLGFDSIKLITAYISGFAAGTILAMVVFAFILGHLSYRLVNAPGNYPAFKILRFASGILAIAVGIYWILVSSQVPE